LGVDERWRFSVVQCREGAGRGSVAGPVIGPCMPMSEGSIFVWLASQSLFWSELNVSAWIESFVGVLESEPSEECDWHPTKVMETSAMIVGVLYRVMVPPEA